MIWIANSHAKINLGLHVLERLPTGYHRIETGLCFIEWADRFEVQVTENYSLSLSMPSIPADERNLITKAYRVFENYVGLRQHYSFHVVKQIPAGAGLGGGSSNAALTLRILNKLEKAGLSDSELTDLSRNLGTDIAFFIQGTPGLATGMGQEIEPLNLQPNAWIVTIYPGFECSTSDAYQMAAPNPDPDLSLRSIFSNEPLEEWRYLLQNDLEAPVIARHEMIGNIRDQIYELGADYAAMTGSGSAVTGLFEQDFVALHAYESFRDLGFDTNITRPGFEPDRGIYFKES